jgi:hypothetical protein
MYAYGAADLPSPDIAISWAMLVLLIGFATWKKSPVAGTIAALLAPFTITLHLFGGVADAEAPLFVACFGLLTVVCLALLTASAVATWLRVPSLIGALNGSAFLFVAGSFLSGEAVEAVMGVAVIFSGLALYGVGHLSDITVAKIGGVFLIAWGAVIEINNVVNLNMFDVVFVGAAVVSAIVEWRMRRSGRLTTPHQYALPALFAGAYGLLGQLAYDDQWNRPVIAVAIGLALAAVGILAKNNAVAAVGIGTLAITMTGQFGPQLAAMPLWAQLFAGGLVLVLLAVFVEARRSNHEHNSATTD